MRRPRGPEWTSGSWGDQRQVVFKGRSIERSREGRGHAALGVDEKRGGQARHAVGLVAANHNRARRVRVLVQLLKAAEATRRVLVVSAYKRHSRVPCGAVRKDGQLLHARRAPGGPEVQDDRLALQLPDLHLLPA